MVYVNVFILLDFFEFSKVPFSLLTLSSLNQLHLTLRVFKNEIKNRF